MSLHTHNKERNDILKALLGLSLTNTHPEIITDTATHSGLNGIAYHAWTNSEFDTGTVIQDASGNTIVGAVVPAGSIVYINFTAIKLASGTGVCYQSK